MKKKICVFTLPAMGHTKEPAKLISKLANDFDVVVFTSSKYADFYKSVSVKIYSINEDEFYFDRNPLLLTKHFLELEDLIKKDTQIDDVVLNSDYVMYDIYAVWGKHYADKYKKQTMSYGITYSQNAMVFLPASFKMTALKYWLGAFSSGRNLFTKNTKDALKIFSSLLPKYSKNHIAFIPEFLQPVLQKNKKHFYVADFENKIPTTSATNKIYVSLGTLYLDIKILKNIILAIKNTGAKAVVSAGKYKQDLSYLEDDNTRIVEFADQETELASASLFVTHAGTNSVLESIKYRVPMVCLPQAVDQFAFADRVQSLGIGQYIGNPNPSQKYLEQIIETSLGNLDVYKNNYKKIFTNNKTKTLDDAVVFIKGIFN
jgi:UDP:flavonoid glycosyltransferase YjiC (YdhE family)